MKRIRHLLVTTAVLLGGTTAVHAATFNVANTDVAGLIAAIQQANVTPGLDTIILAANGNYTLTQVHNIFPADGQGANGLAPVRDDLRIIGNGSVVQRHPGAPVFRFFYVDQGSALELHNLTLHNGRTSEPSPNSSNGGAILAEGNLILSGCVFSSNVSTHGSGGAISTAGDLKVDASRFLKNSCDDAGGAIFRSGQRKAAISGSTFEDNSARLGGAIRWGGGASTISRSTFVANEAVSGGAVNTVAETLVISNSTFSSNVADGDQPSQNGLGGGVFGNLGSISIVHSTFIGNAAHAEGSVLGEGGNIYISFATLHLSNSLLAFSSAGGDCVLNVSSMPTNVNNLIRDGSCQPTFSGDPEVAALDNYGGPTETHALLVGSPARDAAATSSCTKTDQRGVTRPVGPACDIGAFEGVLPVRHRLSAITKPPLFIQPCDPLRDTLPGTITVIVLGDNRVDATALLPDSVTVGNARPGSALRSSIQDVDGDRDMDLMLEFAATDVYRGLSCQSTTSLAVDGLLTNGERFSGLLVVTPGIRRDAGQK